jgi:hypothetical protein
MYNYFLFNSRNEDQYWGGERIRNISNKCMLMFFGLIWLGGGLLILYDAYLKLNIILFILSSFPILLG